MGDMQQLKEEALTRTHVKNKKKNQESGMLNVWTYPGADGAAPVDALPDLNEQSSSLVFPRLTVYQGEGKTPLWWVNLGGR